MYVRGAAAGRTAEISVRIETQQQPVSDLLALLQVISSNLIYGSAKILKVGALACAFPAVMMHAVLTT